LIRGATVLEKQIEAKVCDYAKERGMLVYKFTSPARMAVPDRMFIYNGRMFFIEFKRGGQKPTAAQDREHERLRQQKINVFVIDDVDKGKWVIETMLDLIEARLC
jgi:hypothetical protein